MFAYIAGSPFVFISLFGVRSENFGWYFGINALGLIVSSQVNVFFLRRFGAERILGVAAIGLAVFGSTLAVASYLGFGAYVLPPLLFLFVSTLGLTFPNATACALSNEGKNAGTAGAFLGSAQFAMAATAANAVSFFHNGTSLPMAGVVGACGVLSLTSLLLLRER
jgi:DHA1 family bicyclomycin/chloramphenicol resistance-like MFS transporter